MHALVVFSMPYHTNHTCVFLTCLFLIRARYTGLHREHIESFAMGHPISTAVPEEAFEHRLLEEELSLQLSLLKEHMPTKPLFQSKTEAEDAFHDTLQHDQALKRAVEEVIQPSGDFLVKESKAMMMLDEETMEAAVVCMVIAAVAVGIVQL